METCFKMLQTLIVFWIFFIVSTKCNPSAWNFLLGNHDTFVNDDLRVLTFDNRIIRRSQDYFHPKATRSRRSIKEFPQCKTIDEDAKKRVTKNIFPLKDDGNFNLALMWVGDKSETQLLLTTMQLPFFAGIIRIFTIGGKKSSKLYKSDDKGFTFQSIQDKVENLDVRAVGGIQKSPLNFKKIIFVSYYKSGMLSIFTSPTKLAISVDAAKTFKNVVLPFSIRQQENLVFHPSREDWILALSSRDMMKRKAGAAWISKDFGFTWTEMMKTKTATAVRWGTGKYQDRIYLATQSGSSIFTQDVTIWRSTDGGNLFDELYETAYSFGVQGGFVFVSSDSKENKQERTMFVSSDGGDNFHEVAVPTVKEERFYAIMDMYKGMVFLHVDDSGDTGVGKLYISGSDGIMYTKSLENHFYTNAGQHDFYRVESMHGVYMTQKLNTSDNTLVSMISYDRGVKWQRIEAPKDACKDIKGECSLHYHHTFSASKGVQAPGPLSSPNAPGIIMMHGQVGDALMGRTDVWLSRNGGYVWEKVAEGAHSYAIGDHGNLIVLYPQVNNTGYTLRYSVDQGKCWNELQFTDENQPMVIRGLVTEPNSTSRSFSLWGYDKNGSNNGNKEWKVVTINFHNMFSRICHIGDFETWSPHAENGKGGCLLGVKKTYKRPKDDSDCFIGSNYNPVVKEEKCMCTNDDLECDYGFEKTDNGDCKRNEKFKLEMCKNNEEFEETFTLGKRLLAGDECEPKDSEHDVKNFIDEHKKCKGPRDGLKTNKPDVVDITNKQASTGKKSHSKTVVVLCILILLVGAAGGIYYVAKIVKANRGSTVRMSTLVNEDDFERDCQENGFDPRPKSYRPYTDETDAEDEDLLPV